MSLALAATAAVAVAQNESDARIAEQQTSGAETVAETTADEISIGVSFFNPVEYRWRVGVKIRGGARSAKNLLATIPVPVNWPEQTVSVLVENFPPEVRSAKYRELNSGVRQLVITIPHLAANELLEASVDFSVKTFQIAAPVDTRMFRIPNRPNRDIKEYLGSSPQISYRHAKLRNQVKEIIAEPESDWDKVAALFDWVRDNIEYRSDETSDSLSVFNSKSGCSEDLVGLFVAMCRAAKVPARMVWVEGAQYAEFYLVDESGAGHWFPCQVAGRREFGGNAEPRIILQKGDNIKVPEKQERQKFCAEFLVGAGNEKPIVKFLRDLLPVD